MQNSSKQNRIILGCIISVILVAILVCAGCFALHYYKARVCHTRYLDVNQYKGLHFKIEKEKSITDDMVDFSLAQYLQKENLKMHDTQSVIKNGDTICLNYTGRYNGSSFRNSDVKGLLITLGNGSIDSSFEKQLLGHKPETIFDVKMTLPENYADSFVAGQEVTFSVQVDYILKSVEVPSVVTDNFVKKYTGYSTLAEYKQYIKNDLEQQENLQCEKDNRKAAITALLDHVKIKKFPTNKLKDEIDTLREKDNSNAVYSNVSEKEYRINMGYKTDEEYEKHLDTLAKANLKEQLAVDAVSKAANLEVPSDFTQKEEEKLAKDLGFDSVKDLKAGITHNEISLTIKKYYIADYLIKQAK